MEIPSSGVRVYTPDSPIRRPRAFLGGLLRDARSARVLVWRLVVRDIAAQYRQTAFGYVWAILPTIILTLVWVVLNSSSFVSINTGSVPYPVYVLTGTVFWQMFLDALNAPLKQLSANKAMLNRVNFPTEALLGSGVAQVVFAFVIRLLVLAACLLIYRVPLHSTFALAIFPALGILVVGTVVGIVIAPLGLLYRDVEQALIVIVSPLMFLTPVVYPPPHGGAIGHIVRLNPLTPMFGLLREALFGGGSAYILAGTLVFAGATVVAVAGWILYRLSLPVLVERMEA